MQPIKLKRGDDEQRLIELKTQVQNQLIPFDLSEVARADLHAINAGKRVLELSTANGYIEILDRTLGQILLNFPHDLTQDATWLSADYDLQLTYHNGKIKTVMTGQILLSPDITNVET